MNILVFLPLAVLAIPIIPAFIEIFRRKDKGPREIPEQTLYEDGSDTSRSIPTLERARAKARVRTVDRTIRVVGDVSIPSGAEIKENIVVHGNLKLGSKSHIYGSIKAFGMVDVGEESVVEGHIISEGRVTIRRNAKVKGVVDSSENIILEENAVVEAASTEKSVTLASGGKINRRISAGVPPAATPLPPPTLRTEKPPFPRREQEREAARQTVPSFDVFFEKRREEVRDEKSHIFKILQDRIKSLESAKPRAIDETLLRALTEREVEIYKLAISGYDVNEIGLKLFMDPVQVQKVINSLIERHYSDEAHRPLSLEKAERVIEGKTGAAQQLELRRKESERGELRVDEVFERLLATKLRTEVKKGLKRVEEGSATEKAKQTDESEEILNEWLRASSLIFEHKESTNENLSKGPNSIGQTEEHHELWGTTSRNSRGKETEEVAKSARRKYLVTFLPLFTLLSILFSEVAYYNATLSVTVWMLFLGVALALAIMTGFYFAKTFSSSRLKVS